MSKTLKRNISMVETGINQEIKKLKSNILHKEMVLKKLKNGYEKDLKRLPTKEKELIDLQRNHDVNSKMYSYLLEKQPENI